MICLFAKNGLGNIIFEIEAAARYAFKFRKSLYIDLNEKGHYGQQNRRVSDYFELRQTKLIEEINTNKFKHPYPSDITLFDRSTIDNELYETKPNNSRISQLQIWNKFDRWKFHWRRKNGKYAVRNAECLGLLGAKHDAVLFLTTYIRNEPERFFHLGFSASLKESALKYFAKNNLNPRPDFAIHIRHTDNLHHAGGRVQGGLKKAIEATEFHIFDFESASSIPTVHVATDSSEVIAVFSSRFNKKVKLQFLPIERSERALHLNNDSKAIQFDAYLSALYDIILLSNSRTLAIMGNSSFSRVARCMQPLHYKCFDWTSDFK